MVTADGNTPPFDFNTGTLQGDTLAPYLFDLVLDRILRLVELEVPRAGLQVTPHVVTRTGRVSQQGMVISDLDYADDICIPLEDLSVGEKWLHALQKHAATVNLQVKCGTTKTAIMACFGAPTTPLKDLHGTEVPYVEEYTYLGRLIHQSGRQDKAIDVRVKKAWAAFHCWGYLWRQKKITPHFKIMMVESVVMPTLVFGAGSWGQLAKRERARLDTIAVSMRRIAHGRASYAELGYRAHRAQLMGEHIFPSSIALRSILRLFGHCMRRDVPFRDVMIWSVHAGGINDRHTNRVQCLLTWVARATGYTAEALISLDYADRKRWREISDEAILRNELSVYGHGRPTPHFRKIDGVCEHLPYKIRDIKDPWDAQLYEEYQEPHLQWPGTHAYTDGSCQEDRAGAGVVLVHKETGRVQEEIMERPPGEQTNNRAELWALIMVLRHVPDDGPLFIHTDSHLVWEFGLTGVYRFWYKDYKTQENSDLLRVASPLILKRVHPVHFIKVRAHIGNPYNERVDDVAKRACALQP